MPQALDEHHRRLVCLVVLADTLADPAERVLTPPAFDAIAKDYFRRLKERGITDFGLFSLDATEPSREILDAVEDAIEYGFIRRQNEHLHLCRNPRKIHRLLLGVEKTEQLTVAEIEAAKFAALETREADRSGKITAQWQALSA